MYARGRWAAGKGGIYRCVVETGNIREAVDGHFRRNFGNGNNRNPAGMARAREEWGGRVNTATGKVEARENWYTGTETFDDRVGG